MRKSPVSVAVIEMVNDIKPEPVIFRIPVKEPESSHENRNPIVDEKQNLTLKWCNYCGEGYVNFCRSGIKDVKCYMESG